MGISNQNIGIDRTVQIMKRILKKNAADLLYHAIEIQALANSCNLLNSATKRGWINGNIL